MVTTLCEPSSALFGPCALLQRRPWLSLYGVRLKAKAPDIIEGLELSEIQCRIPDELMLIVLSKLDAYSLGRAAVVCRHWHVLSEHPRLWERACKDAFRLTAPEPAALQKLVAAHRYSWKRLFVHHPHLRFDGVYVARNTYVRTGVVEFARPGNPVHLVSYYRYFRFFSDGTFLYRTSPSVVSKVAKSMRSADTSAHHSLDRDNPVHAGRYIMKGAKVFCLLVYPNSRSTEIRMRLILRSTHPGAHNRLDVESIATWDKELNMALGQAPAPGPDEEPDAAAGQARMHNRGLGPCVFVPWEAVNSTPLNLPAREMDFFVPG